TELSEKTKLKQEELKIICFEVLRYVKRNHHDGNQDIVYLP
ncbi:uncharacterized protein METZ01_LOCUS471399, partial [marine metagenome]